MIFAELLDGCGFAVGDIVIKDKTLTIVDYVLLDKIVSNFDAGETFFDIVKEMGVEVFGEMFQEVVHGDRRIVLIFVADEGLIVLKPF